MKLAIIKPIETANKIIPILYFNVGMVINNQVWSELSLFNCAVLPLYTESSMLILDNYDLRHI